MESSRAVPNIIFSGELLHHFQVLKDVNDIVNSSSLHPQLADNAFEAKRLLALVPEVGKYPLA